MAQDTRERILQAATRVFGKFGYTKTNIEDIAREAGIAKATIYHYFTSKEDVFLTIVRNEARSLENRIDEALKKVPGPREKLKTFFLTQYKHLFEHVNFYNLTQEQLLGFHPIIFKGLNEFDAYRQRRVREIVQQGIQQGVFKPFDVNLLTEMIIDLNKGAFFPLKIQRPDFDVEKHIDFLFEIIFSGIVSWKDPHKIQRQKVRKSSQRNATAQKEETILGKNHFHTNS
jgi:AcrR family transcriptional regulator